MHPDDEPGRSGPGDPGGDPPSVRRDSPASPGVPPTIRDLSKLGITLVGTGITVAVVLGRPAWMGLGLMVIAILAMMMAHEGGWTRRRHRPVGRALKRTRVSPGSAGSKEKAPRRTRTRRGGRGEEKGLTGRADAEPPRLGDGRVPPGPPLAPEREPVREEAPPKEAARVDRRG